jgi:L-ribulose-5-phosphate 3-epimerase
MARADRRRFIKSTAALATLAALRPPLSLTAGVPRTAIAFSMLPRELTVPERFGLAADAGFSGIEMRTLEDKLQAEQVLHASERTGLPIHSVAHDPARRFPLSSRDVDVVRQGVAGIEISLRNARLWGADAVSITPASAAQNTSYQDAWNRSQKVIREQVLPLAREIGIVLVVEDVWDGFVLGPSEAARYVDALGSEWVKTCFDMSRTVFYARPHDWIRALDSRLMKLRVTRILETGIDWLEVRKALNAIAYDGWVTAEIAGGDTGSLGDIGAALRRRLNG